MTVLEIPTDDLRPEPKRDRYGRYVIPDPDTGKDRSWTRATTWAKSCSDTFGLTKWELRMTALGLAKRADLMAQVSTVTDPDDKDAKKLLDGICTDAKEAAGASVRRNLGTALHSMTEHLDAGRDFTMPDAHRADLEAYREATAGLVIDPAHIERIVTVPEHGVAGTFDRLVTRDGRLMVADLKTGKDVTYGMGEIAIQLALYANAATIYDVSTGTHTPMPDVDRETALVFHLPVGEGTCTIYEVDIAAGWEMSHICGVVREWRKRRNLGHVAKAREALATPATVEPPAVPVPADRDEWITGRVTVLVASTAAKKLLGERWPAKVAKVAPWTAADIDAITPVLDAIEATVEAPFPHRDPAAPSPADEHAARTAEAEAAAPDLTRRTPDDGDTVDDGDRDALKAKAAELHKARAQRCAAWRAEGERHGNPWGGARDGAWTQRCWADNRAALLCVTHLWDDDDPDALTRAALAVVIGEDLHPTWPTGAVIGTLSVDEAEALSDLACAFGANDSKTCAALGERIAAA